MLAFIKNKIAEKMPDVVNHTENDIPDSVVVECAHLIQELDELTIEGQDAIDARNGVSDRPLANALDIPLEDDIEIGSLELNVLDGRLTDTPGDASVPTVNEYALNTSLKTEEDFYKEACEYVKPFFRDSEEAMEERRQEYVQKKMAEYREYLVQEGLFGFGKIDINDPQVPVNTMINFGPIKEKGSKDYIVKLPVYFQVDKNRKITKKQLESLTVINSIDGFSELRAHIYDTYSGHSNFKYKEEEIWDHATPKEALVPVDPPDKYCVIVVIDTEWDGEQLYSCRVKMKGLGKEKKAEIKKAVNIQNKKSVYKNAKDVIKEQAEILEAEKMGRFPSRFVQEEYLQEEVDLGSDGDVTDNPPASNADSDVTIDVNGDEGTASVDTSDNPPSSDAPADDSSTGDTTTEIPVETNDVSDEIADKVASESQGMGSDEAINDDLNNISDDDVSGLDTSMDGADLPGDDSSSINPEDFDNMSIDDLINQGSEKLKSMSIGQLKQFLSGDENLDPMVEEAFQEAFFLTPRNINKEIYKELKRVLGILNDSQEPSDTILKKFKKYSRRLNRALVKAAKMEKVYSDQERQAFKKANKCLLDLNVIIGSEKDANYGATVKRLILAFVSESRRVEQIVVDHEPSLKETEKEEKKGMSALKTGIKS